MALRKFHVNEFKDLPSLVFISAFLASAGRNVTELSCMSKVISELVNIYFECILILK